MRKRDDGHRRARQGRDLCERQQTEREALRDARCATLDELRVTYVALARRWRVYTMARSAIPGRAQR